MWLYRLLLSFLHIILYLRFIVLEILWKTRRFVAGVFGSRGTSCNEIHLHSSQLNKLPLHISLLILEPQIVFTDIAKLIVWSMALGISYISIFDRKGIFKKNAAKLSSEIIYKQREVFTEETKRYTFILRTRDTKFDHSLAPKQVCISLLSEEDGRGDIVQAAQDFCLEIQRKEALPKQMEVELMDQMLKATRGIPDPELALKFGNIDMLMGFLPWQTRLTEFISCKSHHHITFSLFLESLQKYSNCEKRFGK
ncbi:dehydrodolichyl diphosphate synthase complex subunit nus1 [Exaiptasia diaphana]|uniref:ditrans,polycis-polyprenyl diphosphate synthase [(2E,6E)-farnesyldiphosphate specific] n=1 Tax=Exaiptasia diaphana TaxID=2652724 RepID=A0A913Y2S8_EXADI|nr:dehydrodolichyl diphosphate synthase complex subunit nus1 [Exaiptasia diaphana]KXJ22833.1 Dehydrodolichyl diphosphate syntase complex subunit nus1 [Exaiptasia diaphana]